MVGRARRGSSRIPTDPIPATHCGPIAPESALPTCSLANASDEVFATLGRQAPECRLRRGGPGRLLRAVDVLVDRDNRSQVPQRLAARHADGHGVAPADHGSINVAIHSRVPFGANARIEMDASLFGSGSTATA